MRCRAGEWLRYLAKRNNCLVTWNREEVRPRGASSIRRSIRSGAGTTDSSSGASSSRTPANWLTLVALTLLVLRITGSGFDVGLLTVCQFGPILLLSAWAGVIADRSNKRNLLILTQVLEMAQSFALGALAFMHHPPLWALFSVALAGGVLPRVRQSGPTVVRHRDGAEGRRAQRGQALQRADQHLEDLRARDRRRARGHRRLRLGVPDRWIQLHRRPRRAVHDADVGAAADAGDAKGQGPGACRPEVRDPGAGALDHVRHARGDRHAQLQLHRPVPPVRDPRTARKRRHVHARVRGVQRRRARRGAVVRIGERSGSATSSRVRLRSARACSCSRWRRT